MTAVTLLLITSCSGDDDEGKADGERDAASTTEGGSADGDGGTTLPPAEASTFEEVDCWWDLPANMPAEVSITCGTVDVPSDHTDPESEPVTLAVMRLHHSDSPASEPPILNLHGGPGGDALSVAPERLVVLPALAERDIIMWDQRGAGRSLPSLNCPEKEEAILATLATADSWDEEYPLNQEAVRECYERLTSEGIDLDLYDTPTSVADMEVLRETFGLDTWNVWGASYGSRLGLAYAREHPDRVRSLLIDSVYAPDVGGVERARELPGAALQRLVDACAEDEACAAAYGDLGDALEAAVADLDENPEELTQAVNVNGEMQERSFAITGTDLRAGMFAALYDSELIPSLPSIIFALSQGDRVMIPSYIDIGIPRLVELSEGAFYAVDCVDSGRAISGPDAVDALEDVDEDALVALNSAQVFCQDWEVEFVPESFNEQVTVDVPTLVYGGTLDPVTPFDESKAQAEAMPDAEFVVVPMGGHGVAAFDDCTKQARSEFWTDPSTELPACVEDFEARPFVIVG